MRLKYKMLQRAQLINLLKTVVESPDKQSDNDPKDTICSVRNTKSKRITFEFDKDWNM